MSYIFVRSNKEQDIIDQSNMFWTKVEHIFGKIPEMIRLILEFNGFDTHLALKGIRWTDKKYFFEALEESINSIEEHDDNKEDASNDLKTKIINELSLNNQTTRNFKLKLGHKNLIINLCHELQNINSEDFNNFPSIHSPQKRKYSELIVRKPEEHGYSSVNESSKKIKSERDPFEPVEYVYEDQDYNEDDEETGNQFIESEYLEQEVELYQEENDIGDYQEVQVEEIEADENALYATDDDIKAHQLDQGNCFEISGYDSSSSQNPIEQFIASCKTQKPKHMYTEEFLKSQKTQGKIGTPGRRRPKIPKNYPATDEGMLERWTDLVRQSCEVIVPQGLLLSLDLHHIDIVKVLDNIWEVRCPLCTKKLRLQQTFEGKYVNYKRSNFERHLRIVHYNQIQQVKPHLKDDEQYEDAVN
ncbi:CLUMA_CG020935, isoform A [Clunio marinus]|uniref:CLUMA_CG020935, isoform A n=1 Tax=Clunio marinus TaxID=568069 RepID=A0A1J1J684_9DIPT|nr:CLUMA_CG020935, isoform A [Clunio marinus]